MTTDHRTPWQQLTVNALNNRLFDLMGYGLATRTRRRREWVYAARVTGG